MSPDYIGLISLTSVFFMIDWEQHERNQEMRSPKRRGSFWIDSEPLYTLYNQETGKLDRRELEYRFNKGKWEYSDLYHLFEISVEARKVVRDILARNHARNLRQKPNAWYTRRGKKEVAEASARGEDPFDMYSQMISKRGRSLFRNSQIVHLFIQFFRMFTSTS